MGHGFTQIKKRAGRARRGEGSRGAGTAERSFGRLSARFSDLTSFSCSLAFAPLAPASRVDYTDALVGAPPAAARLVMFVMFVNCRMDRHLRVRIGGETPVSHRPRLWPALLLGLICSTLSSCATIRVTDPPRSATEQFLMSEATRKAVEQLSAEALRDREVFVDTSYVISSAYPTPENLFYIGEIRNKLLLGGVRLVDKREKAKIILEVRTGGIGNDRLEFLIGIPALYISGYLSQTPSNTPIVTPDFAIVKQTKQMGFASAAFVAYWADTGELVASSGPFVGRTLREDWWFFGFGPRTISDIPPGQKP